MTSGSDSTLVDGLALRHQFGGLGPHLWGSFYRLFMIEGVGFDGDVGASVSR